MSSQKLPKNTSLRNAEYYDMQLVFDELYAKSRNGEVFTEILPLVTASENILLAYRNIKSNSGSRTAGTDGKNITHLSRWDNERLIRHVQKKLAWYTPQAIRRVEIPKDNGKTRPLGIPTIMDRLIQQCFLQVLEPICEAKFHERSNGFRPNRGAEHALAQAERYMQRAGLQYVVDIDIKGFFDNVSHGKLLKQMWAMGIRDKSVLSIISRMLKAEVAGIGFPEKGTPQGGIISPLLSNIVLNELDWWIHSQWEGMPTRHEYFTPANTNGSLNQGKKYRALKGTNLKECFMVRYADDFKIFCRNRADAERIFIATKDWLRCRLGLEISPEKSRIVNLRKQYSEFLGFRLKLHRKGKMPNGTAKYTVRSRMSDKAKRKVLAKARVALKAIEFPSDAEMEYRCIQKYNAMVMGWHNYYAFATMASMDFARLAFSIERRIRARLGKRVRKRRPNDHIGKQYGRYRNSAQIRFVNGTPLLPLGYVKHKTPMDKRRSINKYTPEGRAEIHSHLLAVDTLVLHYLMRNPAPDRSIQYNDNRLALYCAQMGKCAVTHRPLKPLNIHCHHKIASCDGGTDDYSNLILVDAAVHKLLHAVHHKVIEARLKMVNLDAAARRKLNELRLLLNLNPV